MRNDLTSEEVATIAALGYSVYMTTNPHFQTYCFYTDGQRIGYLQREELTGGLSISTVHMPNRQTGTGFKIGEISTLTHQALESGFMNAPGWASDKDRESVKKYKSLDDFLSSRHTDLVCVAQPSTI